MPTPVYTLVVNALSSSVSARAADTMLKAALKDAQVSPDGVTASEMQAVLSGPLLRRLASVLPQAQASRDLRALSRRVAEDHPRALTLFSDPEGPLHWDSLDENGLDTDGVGLGLRADDFEYEDPDFSAFQGEQRHYDLTNAIGQDALLSDLARQPGVQGVVICAQDGQVLRSRANRNEGALSSIVAATVMLFRNRSLNILCADLGPIKVCMRPLGEYCVAVLAGEQVNIGRVIAELQQLREAA
ncbi:roadblock/LC7 domain-containing protein [Deinococcus altitudinis]|uniref:roadblock/LC7 domain-containing protein n=1 Tax=Deinococcus altitudinis TaxID=468914 RepID=UPI003891F127